MSDFKKIFVLFVIWILFFAGIAYGFTYYVNNLKDYFSKF